MTSTKRELPLTLVVRIVFRPDSPDVLEQLARTLRATPAQRGWSRRLFGTDGVAVGVTRVVPSALSDVKVRA